MKEIKSKIVRQRNRDRGYLYVSSIVTKTGNTAQW